MPEGPELHMGARFVNAVAKTKEFGGPIKKSAVSTKNPDVTFNVAKYDIRAEARGKELKIYLTDKKKKTTTSTHLLIRFGMSGCFRLTRVQDLPKHAHLQFYTTDGQEVLSFVDYRRFGRWEVEGDWGKDRGPDAMTETEVIPEEVMLNKLYFFVYCA